MVADITERRRAELGRERAEQRFQAVVESLSEGLIVLGLDGRIVSANASVQRILGRSEEEMLAPLADARWSFVDVSGNPIERPFIAEAVVSLGPRIPKLPYAQPGDAARAALAPWCELVDAVLLGNHGAIAWGTDPEQALLRLELVEHLARIAIAAQPLGGVDPLPESAIAPLLAEAIKRGGEFYSAAQKRLRPDGILQQWAPGGDAMTTAAVARSLLESFPYVRAFISVQGWGMHYLASRQPIPDRSAAELAKRMPASAAARLAQGT